MGDYGLRQRRRDDQDYLLPQTSHIKVRLPPKTKSGLTCCKFLFFVFVGLPLSLVGFGSYLVFTPGIIDPQYYSMPEPPELTGPLAVNDMLTKAERLMEGEISGPESILLDQGKLYTGTYNGKVVEILKNEVLRFVRWGPPPCGSYITEPTCGRPLGVRMTSNKQLIVADAYLGIYSVNIVEGKDVF
uniref:Adipocyte plasma membrane-associated protein n=1 Tax=Plectus sambesii TaxID=2011161 RepID=A0A914X7P3_9BILA